MVIKYKNNKAITLVGLVITIIVLLILAGIAISLILGDRGIFKLAQIAGNNYIDAQEKELLDLDELYGSIKIANDGTLNVSMDQLNTIIDKRVENALKNQPSTGGTIPVGTVIAMYSNNAPAGYLKCDGEEYNISDYSELAELIKNTSATGSYGSDTEGKFKVPNLQGEFLRGTGTNGYAGQGNGGNTTGIHQDATTVPRFIMYGANGSYILQRYAPAANSTYSSQNGDASVGPASGHWINYYQSGNGTDTSSNVPLITVRPTNTSVLYCIKY